MLTESLCQREVVEAARSGRLPSEYLSYVRQLCEGAVRGHDAEAFRSLNEWVDWLAWSTVLIDREDYLKAAVYALNLAPRLAGTDYGTSRQRDLGQLWTDTIRGFLGEVAFAEWVRERFGIELELDYRKGMLEEFLSSDIKSFGGKKPRHNLSIKTTKFSGVWLDIPYKQIEHSDVFVLVRVGVTREHFLAFLKDVSVVRDKLLAEARRLNIITDEELKDIWNSIPSFRSIPAYVAGFFDKTSYGNKVKDRTSVFLADGRISRRKGVEIIIVNKYAGYWNPSENEYEKYRRRVVELFRSQGKQVSDTAKIEFEGIGRFTPTLHFIVSSGVLKRYKEDWESLFSRV